MSVPDTRSVDFIGELFNPRSIAVIGASEDPVRVGTDTVRALQENGYPGAVYPVNPKYERVFGYRCFPSLESIDAGIDIAVIAIPAVGVLGVIHACIAKKVRNAVILSGGFRETGPEGAALQDEIVRVARAGGLRIVGPNCLGYVNLPANVYAGFGSITRPPKLPRGPVSLVTQSGGFGYSIALECGRQGIGFRNIIATGNEADVDSVELIEALVNDAGTETILVYLEGLRDGRALVRAGRKALDAGKPLLVWKGGATPAGAGAAASHTANMVGDYDYFRAAFEAAGIVEIHELQEAADFVKAFRSPRYPQGKRVAVMGGSGGSAIVFTDAIQRHGCELSQFSGSTMATLRELLPSIGTVGNPVDFTAGFIATRGATKYAAAVRAVASDVNVDAVCFTLATIGPKGAHQAAQVLGAVAREIDKPFFVFLALDEHSAPDAYAVFETFRIPVFSSPVRAGRAIAMLAHYAQRKSRIAAESPSVDQALKVTLPPAPFMLSEQDSKAVLRSVGVSTTVDRFFRVDQTVNVAGMRSPFVVKAVSRDIPHKTEVGAVRLGVELAEVQGVALEMLNAVRAKVPAAMIDGVLVSEMVKKGFELLLGTVRDPAFGPIVVLGMGGIYAEAFADRTCRLAPMDLEEAHEMIAELKCASILCGLRGQPALDVSALARLIVIVSRLAWDKRQVLSEIDINPIIVRADGEGALAADALMIGA